MANFYITCPIDSDFVKAAKKSEAKIHEIKKSLPKSITNGERNEMAFVSELYYKRMTCLLHGEEPVDWCPNFDYDFLVEDFRVDVKAKQRTVRPRKDYAASVAAYQHQKLDIYAFTQITVEPQDKNDFKRFCYFGTIDAEVFYKTAKYMRKGELDSGNIKPNGQPFTITENCYNLPYSELRQYSMAEAAELLEPEGFNLVKW